MLSAQLSLSLSLSLSGFREFVALVEAFETRNRQNPRTQDPKKEDAWNTPIGFPLEIAMCHENT